jgi:hypothetical protein
LAYQADGSNPLKQLAVFNTTPNGIDGGGGIWMSGQGLVADSNSFVYLITGNSARSDENSPLDYGESFLKLGLSAPALVVQGSYRAPNFDALNQFDTDLGSGGAVAIPGTPYIVGGGKQGFLYLVNTNGMGLQQQPFQADKGLWGSPVIWTENPNGPTLYVWGVNDRLKAFTYNGILMSFNTNPAAESSPTIITPDGDGCGALSLTSNGNLPGTGILWATIPLWDPDHQTAHGKLCAFDATNLANELWDSRMDSSRDDYHNFAKFVPPTIANGKVYVATDNSNPGQVCAYGLISSTLTPSPDKTVLLAGQGGQIVDSALNIWTIQNAVVTVATRPLSSPCAFENGSIAGYNYNVAEMAYVGGIIWVENRSGLWYSWKGSSWVAGTNPL